MRKGQQGNSVRLYLSQFFPVLWVWWRNGPNSKIGPTQSRTRFLSRQKERIGQHTCHEFTLPHDESYLLLGCRLMSNAAQTGNPTCSSSSANLLPQPSASYTRQTSTAAVPSSSLSSKPASPAIIQELTVISMVRQGLQNSQSGGPKTIQEIHDQVRPQLQ
jgi:hypothetical protein